MFIFAVRHITRVNKEERRSVFEFMSLSLSSRGLYTIISQFNLTQKSKTLAPKGAEIIWNLFPNVVVYVHTKQMKITHIVRIFISS